MFWKNLGNGARVEIAPGFHTSETHVAGVSVPSHLFTTDWLIQPMAKLQWTGMFFTGENAAGIGASFLAQNAGKKSVELDLKDPGDQAKEAEARLLQAFPGASEVAG